MPNFFANNFIFCDVFASNNKKKHTNTSNFLSRLANRDSAVTVLYVRNRRPAGRHTITSSTPHTSASSGVRGYGLIGDPSGRLSPIAAAYPPPSPPLSI